MKKLWEAIKRSRSAVLAVRQILLYGGIQYVNFSSVAPNEVLKGKNIVITGGGSGIGFEIAKRCIEAGGCIIITGRNEQKLVQAIKSLNSPKAHYIVWDLENISDIAAQIDTCENIFKGSIDIFVNNAGAEPKAFFPEVTVEEWERIYTTNSRGTFFTCQEMCKHWAKERPRSCYKKILNISSQGGFVGATYPYRMSKWDIRGLTEGLGAKMAPYGILVNGIAPGIVRTQMQEFAMKQGDNVFCSQNLLQRVCLPEEIAELAVFMISDSCNFMVGQTILVDGGYALK